jgi:cytochrome c oxidase cbb3-type subunit 3
MTTSTAPQHAVPSDRTEPAETAPEPDARGAQLLDHEYDGIREYDNPLPGWWVYAFWASFVFSVGYLFHFHISENGDSVAETYEADMASAREERAKHALGEKVTEAGLAQLSKEAALMADAEALFAQRCMQCHGAHGEGGIGPNLTDGSFIHGSGSLLDIYATVSNGVPAKGMPAWSLQLTSMQVSELAALVGTFQGKNLPGKVAEGSPMPAR